MPDLLDLLRGSANTGVPIEALPSSARGSKLRALREELENSGRGTIRIHNDRVHLLLGPEIFRDYGDRKVCRACNLAQPVQVPYRGPIDAEIVIVGEAPGKEEELQQLPFVGPTGQEVKACLRHAGLQESEILFCNPICCRPQYGAKASKEDTLTCARLFLYRWLAKHPRKLIIAMGNYACYAINPEWEMKGIESRRGTPVWSDRWNCLVLPVLHPASMLKAEPNDKTVRSFAGDIVRAAQLKKRGYKFQKPEVKVDVAWLLEQFEDWKTRCEKADLIAVDIETVGKDFHLGHILSISIAVDEKEALVIPIESRFVTQTADKKLLKEIEKKWPDRKPAWLELCEFQPASYDVLSKVPSFNAIEHTKYLRPLGFRCYWSLESWIPAYKFLKYVLEELPVPKTLQNGTFDTKFLSYQYGIEVTPFAHDTIIMHQLTDENGQHGLDAIAADVLGYISHKDVVRETYKRVCSNWKIPVTSGDYSLIPPDTLHQYNGEDTAVQWACTKALQSKLADEGPLMQRYYERLLMPIWHIVRGMEQRGIGVDLNHLRAANTAFTAESKRLRQALIEEAELSNFNPNSPKQLQEVLYSKFRLPIPRDEHGAPLVTGGGDPKTDKEALQFLKEMRPGFIGNLLKYRSIEKLRGSYITKIMTAISPVSKRVHPQYAFAADRDWVRDENYGAAGTQTGRLSSSGGIAIQTIPKKSNLRPLFYAGEGRLFVEVDYKNAELRVWAALSGDPELRKAVLSQDVHRAFASRIFNLPEDQITDEQRAIAKTFVFASGYGAEPYTLSLKAGIPQEKAEAILNSMKRSFSVAYAWMDEVGRQAEVDGYIQTFLGRKRRPPGLIYVDRKIRAKALRQCSNTPVQGTALEVCFVGWLKTVKALEKAGLDAYSETQVHDSVLFSCREDEIDKAREIILENMTDPIPQLGVPLEVDLDEKSLTHWGGTLDLEKILEQ